MTIPKRTQTELRGPRFGGCRRLLGQYKTIGHELLDYEKKWRGSPARSFGALRAFREGVVFVPLEVLEGFLEDILDVDVSEERLFIVRDVLVFTVYLLQSAVFLEL